MKTFIFLTIITISAFAVSDCSASEPYDLSNPLKNLVLSGYLDSDNKVPQVRDEFSLSSIKRSGRAEDKWSNFNDIRTNLSPEADLVEIESSPSFEILEAKSDSPKPTVMKFDQKPNEEQENSEDTIKTIAFNSREVRLVGPNQKEVEMKDDVGTKMMIAIENLQKEASDVWGQVNEKLDKGWTELKTMIEGAISPSTAKRASQQQQSRH